MALSPGGSGTLHNDDASAYNVRVVGNRGEKHLGSARASPRVGGCAFENHDIADAGAGVFLDDSVTNLERVAIGLTRRVTDAR